MYITGKMVVAGMIPSTTNHTQGMKKMKKVVSIIFLLTFALSGCVSFTTMQTANTLAPGESEGGLNMVQTKVALADEPVGGVEESITYVVPEFTYRRGIVENLDLGIKFYPMAAEIDAKYQFIKAGGFVLSGDFGFAYSSIESGSGDNTVKTTYLDLYPTVLITYNFSEFFSLTAGPKYIYRSIGGDAVSDSIAIPGVTLTAAIGPGAAGNGFKFMPEVGYFTADGLSYTTLGIGLAF